jgi:hypothetical protein
MMPSSTLTERLLVTAQADQTAELWDAQTEGSSRCFHMIKTF